MTGPEHHFGNLAKYQRSFTRWQSVDRQIRSAIYRRI